MYFNTILSNMAAILIISRSTLAFQPSRMPLIHGVVSFSSHNLSSLQTIGRHRCLYLSTQTNVGENTEPEKKLIDLAKTFIQNKNAAGCGEASLDGVFDMCCLSTVDLYGLKGEDVKPGFTAFFESHQGLCHELMEEPTVVGPGIVQYPFIKKWRSEEEGDEKVWKSIDPEKPRKKVERLGFNSEGKLEKVSVVEADSPL
mmetsp:Transcript_458/g.573  ORF Transcript_458/g.573 Transcript_458/m.573 type:complete len:200 (+) Transcript_458:43-642(+)